ncbi:MAG: hypothetical protein LBS97_04425 [Treponema sp.]|jgi:hypothetical protein|nr:hypothetical protein [Treponema sp.]
MKRIVTLGIFCILFFSLSAYERARRYPSGDFHYDWASKQLPAEYSYYQERPWLASPADYDFYTLPKTNVQYNYVPAPQGPVFPPSYDYGPPPVAVPRNVPQRAAPSFDYRDLEYQNAHPTIGYLDLEWGSSVPLLLRLYPDCEEITDENDSMIGIRRFIQERVGGGIDSRQFVFFQNQLYEVYVLYGYVDELTTQLMRQKLESIYGQVFKTTERESRARTAYFNMIDHYMNYDWNLQIIFTTANVYNYYNYKLGTIMTCLYVNVRAKNEVERSKQNIRRDTLPL